MPDIAQYSSILIGAAIVAALIIAAILAVKLIGGSVRGRRGSRLGISEYHEIDKTRRLVLVRRDDVEHLLLIGGGQDIVVESSIGTPLAPQQSQAPAAPRPAPRPAVFGARRPVLRPVSANDGDDNSTL